ncbi:MAG: hypothetical protein WDN28_24885 [Chthoniobacter sp.]
MTIIFSGAPVLNALISLMITPPPAGWSRIPLPFWFGILMAVCGGALVTKFKPGPLPKKPAAAPVVAEQKA